MITPLAPDSGTTTLAVTECDLFLSVEHAVLADPHAGEQQLAVAADQLRTPRDVGVDALEAAVVERHDVVLDGLDQPESLQLGELLGILCGQVMRLRPVVGPVQLPHVVVERRRLSAIHGVRCLVTAVQPWW